MKGRKICGTLHKWDDLSVEEDVHTQCVSTLSAMLQQSNLCTKQFSVVLKHIKGKCYNHLLCIR